MEKEVFITCPYCGTEYVPAEIYNPNFFFGRPEKIERTYDGKIKQYEGSPMDLKEEYKCDCCNKTFYITAQLRFISNINERLDFDQDYTSSLKIKKFSLLED